MMYHIPYSILHIPLEYFGFGELFREMAHFFLALFLPGIFMYLFLDKFLGKKILSVFKICGALLYLFNPYTMIHPLAANMVKLTVFVSLPLFSYLIWCIFENNKWKTKIALSALFILVTPTAAPAFVNIAETIPLFAILTILIIYGLFTHKNKPKLIMLFTGILLASFFVNFWWIYGSLWSMYLISDTLLQSLSDIGVSPKVFDALRLFGFWALPAHNNGLPYYTFGQFYYRLRGVLITFVIPILVFFPMAYFAKFKKYTNEIIRRKTLLFLGISILGIFLVKGKSDPLGGIYEYFYESVKIFRIFRESYSKFTLISLFSFCAVLPVSLHYISKLLKKHFDLSHTVVVILFLIYLPFAFSPMFNGQIIRGFTHGPMKGEYVKIPEYWKQLSAYTKNNVLGGRILTLPKNSYYKKSYLWEKGYVGRPGDLFTNGRSLWFTDYPGNSGDVLTNDLYNEIEKFIVAPSNNGAIKITNLMRILNVSHTLQMNDFDYIGVPKYKIWSSENIDKVINIINIYSENKERFGLITREYLLTIPHVVGGENIHRFPGEPTKEDYLANFGDKSALILHKLREELNLHKIYIPDVIQTIPTYEEYLKELESPDYLSKKPMFISENVETGQYNSSDVSVETISESKYKVTPKSLPNGKFPIIFNETYDEGWKIATDCGWLKCNNIIEANHFKANYYGNGWIVDSEKLENGSFYIVHNSEFRLKNGILVSTFFSVVTLLVCVVFSNNKLLFRFKLRKSG